LNNKLVLINGSKPESPRANSSHLLSPLYIKGISPQSNAIASLNISGSNKV